jgi:hypothetical protein
MGFFDCQPHLQRLAVGLFHFSAQSIETLPSRFEVFGVQSEHVVLPAEIGPLRVALFFPLSPRALQVFAVGFQPFFERSALAIEQFPFTFGGSLPFFEEFAMTVQLTGAEQVLRLDFFEACPTHLLLAAKLRLDDFKLLHRPSQMFLLKAMPIVEEHPLLLQLLTKLLLFGEQVFALPLEVLELSTVKLFQLLSIVFPIDDELFALDMQGVPFAEQRFVELFQFRFELQAGVGPLRKGGLLSRNSELALLEAGLDFFGPHASITPLLIDLRKLGVQPLFAAINVGKLLPELGGNLFGLNGEPLLDECGGVRCRLRVF